MRVIVYSNYGVTVVFYLKEVEKPTPKGNEILIKIKAIAVYSCDRHCRKSDPAAVRLFFGLFKPQ